MPQRSACWWRPRGERLRSLFCPICTSTTSTRPQMLANRSYGAQERLTTPVDLVFDNHTIDSNALCTLPLIADLSRFSSCKFRIHCNDGKHLTLTSLAMKNTLKIGWCCHFREVSRLLTLQYLTMASLPLPLLLPRFPRQPHFALAGSLKLFSHMKKWELTFRGAT